MSSAGVSSPDRRTSGSQPPRFARACTRCRLQKLACKPGPSGTYPCARCEDSSSQCVLVEKQRAVPIPTLSSKLARQEATISDLSNQLHQMQTHLSRLADLPSRLAAVEHRVSTLSGDHPSASRSVNLQAHSGSLRDFTLSPLHPTGSYRDLAECPPQEHEEEAEVLQNFVDADLNTTRVLSDVRVYRRAGSARPGKRKRIEEEQDACSMAFTIFSVRCLPSLTFVDPDDPQITVDQVQDLSALLFWAIVAVGSRETPELYETFVAAHENTMELLRATLGGPKPTYWDVCGAMVWNKYLSPLRPIGHLVDLAYELDIHRSFEMLRDKEHPSKNEVRKIRLWLSMVIQDYSLSAATGRPPHYQHRNKVIEQAAWLVSQPEAIKTDYRILSTIEYEEIAHSIIYETMRAGSLAEDWKNQVENRCAAIDDWYARWEPIGRSKSGPDELVSMLKAIKVNRHLAKMSVYSVVLRGIKTTDDLTPQRQRCVDLAVAEARKSCQLCVKEFQPPVINYLGETLVYGFIFAATFLLKVIWVRPTAYPVEEIFEELEAVIEVFRAVSGQLHAHFLSQVLKHVRKNNHMRTRASTPQPPYAFPNPSQNAMDGTMPFDQFDVDARLDMAQGSGLPAASMGMGMDAEQGMTGEMGPMLGTDESGVVDMLGDAGPDFWSWLSSEGQNLAPFINTLDGFDSSLAMGGI